MKQTEIERKWLMEDYPPLEPLDECVQHQAYLAFEPVTVRIRRIQKDGAERFELTIKGKGTLSRTEVETPLDREQYEALLPLAAAPAAQKRMRRYRLPGGEVLECSWVDEGTPDAFCYAEVEFESEAAAMAFTPPPYFGREVTEEPGYTMAQYCLRKSKIQHPGQCG